MRIVPSPAAIAAGAAAAMAAAWLLAVPGAGAWAAPANPAGNIAPVPDFQASCVTRGGAVVSGYCAYDAAAGTWTFETPARESAALAAIDAAHAALGLPALVLPANWPALTPDEQQFVLIDLERVDEGLAPIVAEAPALDAVAMAGAQADEDPVPPAPWTQYATASNWAGDAQPAVTMYGYLYLDGWGGTAQNTANLDCTGPAAPGCWGHRDSVLGDYGATGLLGLAAIPGAGSGTGSSAQFYVAYDGPPVAVGYTWADALAEGAGGASDPPAAANPLWPFSDLGADAWAAGAAAALDLAGVVQGTGPSTFSPGDPVELEEMAAFLGRALGWNGDPAAAPPGTDPYAAGAMGYAADRGLLPAGAVPTAALTRLQAAALVVSALALPPAAAPMPYSDLGGLSGQDMQVLTTAVADGLLQGSGGQLDPSGGLTRAQAAVILMRALLRAARNGRAAAGPLKISAQSLSGGRVLYTVGSVLCLAASASADPAVYWLPQSGAMLAGSAGSWWTGQSRWAPLQPPAWAAGASLYGEAIASLWPAGSQGNGPALFATAVYAATFSGDAQELLPGAPAWTGAAAGVAQDPARADADALLH